MNLRYLVLVFMMVAPFQASMAAEESLPVSENLLKKVYTPSHRNFADASLSWVDEFGDLCKRRPTSSAYKMQFRFAEVLELYSVIEVFKLGPLLVDNLQSKLYFWPDTRGILKRQLTTVLDSVGDKAVNVAELAGKSAAVQGFAALERLLYEPEYVPLEASPQCHLAVAIVENIASIAGKLNYGWREDAEFVQSMLHPQNDSIHFRSEEEVHRSLYTQAKVGLDILMEEKLRPLLSNDPVKMRLTPMWISQRTTAILTGNLKGIRALLLDSGLLDGTGYEEKLRIEFDYIDQVLSQLKPITYFVERNGKLKKEVRVGMYKLAAVVNGVKYILNDEVAPLLNLRAGFNSADGD